MRALFHQQSLFKQRLHKRYYFELVALYLLKMTDALGNPLTLYQSDYTILITYLKNQGISDFSQLGTLEKLNHIERAQVRLTRFFSSQNLKDYELDVKSTTESSLSQIINKGGTALCKDGEQNCVVLFEGHVYIHPKIRALPGRVYHEVMPDLAKDPTIKKGAIGVYHSSFSQGQQVSFAGSIVFDKNLGWILENTSGHYFPSAYQIKPLLIALQEQGMDLSKLTIRLWTLKKPGTIAPDFNESYFDVLIENAAEYMKRMEHSQTHYSH
ncbi:TPA: hypothetical protein JAN90_02590 [Legionella pneumophila]|nr:hypothetical protein [Legionella pneumophila]HAT8868551.1 hypothetical protein [Legionella pneumophila subsp. pneumophila]HAT7071674.1 hypothetical protein [Legionella pneumophila]HAT8642398.1 hypothetical protein [Legionella pneumophila]HAT8889770.1 hypothetical protein [Legionella pneumophila subsp. pneumophila]HAT8931961.1 hypothetical protein [Legionella pneumophila subsp. pneumophila]